MPEIVFVELDQTWRCAARTPWAAPVHEHSVATAKATAGSRCVVAYSPDRPRRVLMEPVHESLSSNASISRRSQRSNWIRSSSGPGPVRDLRDSRPFSN